MGQAGHASSFRQAVDGGHYKAACGLARELEPIEPVDALRLTILAAEQEPDPERVDAMAVRTIDLMIESRNLTLGEIAALAVGLVDVKAGRREGRDLLQLEREFSWRGQ
jgi:hypothetical protein